MKYTEHKFLGQTYRRYDIGYVSTVTGNKIYKTKRGIESAMRKKLTPDFGDIANYISSKKKLMK